MSDVPGFKVFPMTTSSRDILRLKIQEAKISRKRLKIDKLIKTRERRQLRQRNKTLISEKIENENQNKEQRTMRSTKYDSADFNKGGNSVPGLCEGT